NRRTAAHDIHIAGLQAGGLQGHTTQYRIGGAAPALRSQTVTLEARDVFDAAVVTHQDRVIALLCAPDHLQVGALGGPSNRVGEAEDTGIQLPTDDGFDQIRT